MSTIGRKQKKFGANGSPRKHKLYQPDKSGDNNIINLSTPELICTKKPSKGNNNGKYTVKIPFKYMLLTEIASSYAFNFIGIKYNE